MNGPTPSVTVVLTTYRRAGQLPSTIDSILSQTHEDFELVVSDDASPDATEQICREFERRDRRIRYRRNPVNLNMPGNLNAALREARAPLVANLHDGDVYRPDLLERWKAALDTNEDAAFVFNACEVVGGDGRRLATYSHEFPARMERGEFVEYMMGRFVGSHDDATRVTGPEGAFLRRGFGERLKVWLSGPFGCPVWGTVMARRRCYEAANWFDSRFGFISDVDMWLRLNAEHAVVYVREPLVSLAPRGNDRPHSTLNWSLEEALAEMFLECAKRAPEKLLGSRGAVARQIRRARMRRWLFLIAVALKHGDVQRAGEGVAALATRAWKERHS
jgi:glycosyltransferase involved in cell wall biosynthesis